MSHFRQGITNIAEICARQGVKRVIIAPGSRNAPLIFSFTQHTDIECLSMTDERSAAYFALGLSRQSHEPVALLCTSGTAVLNFAPAIAEAYYQNIPLLVFTADRPAELIDQADGQTLKQNNIFGNYIKAAFELPVETAADNDLYFSDRQVSQAIDTAIQYPQGPVQINVPLREPIYAAIPASHSNPKIVKILPTVTSMSQDTMDVFRKKWLEHKQKIIVLGVFPKNEQLQKWIRRLSQEPDVVILAENLSNIAGNKIITQPESLFSRINAKSENANYAPDLLITVGHSMICKQLKIFLRNHTAAEQWQIESSMPYVDTYKSLTTIIPGKAIDFFSEMPLGKMESDFASTYHAEIKQVQQHHDNFTNAVEVSDMTITKTLLEKLPAQTTLHLANSTSVRWTQLFPARPDLTYICNRGTSGIDGSLSTAAGYAYASGKPTVFLTGDLSFIYDSNGLWNNYISPQLKIIVMNNNGGNIFRFIGDKELMANSIDFFTTPHHVKISALAEAYGLNYLSCESNGNLEKAIDNLLTSEKATILEIFTDSDLNTKNYNGYFQNIKL